MNGLSVSSKHGKGRSVRSIVQTTANKDWEEEAEYNSRIEEAASS